MPEVPGQGSQYFELRLLALGQHIALKDIDKYQSIKEVTDQMIKAFQEPKDGVIPIGGSGLLSFDENSNWLDCFRFWNFKCWNKRETNMDLRNASCF